MTEPAALRARLRAQRLALGAAARIAAAAGLAGILESLPEFLVDTNVAGYWAVAGELPLNVVHAALARREQRYCLPVLARDRSLRFAPWQPGGELAPNRFGIPEPVCVPARLVPPTSLDLVLVPLLGFDRRGNRLGTGGGYYDRTFAFLAGVERPARPLLVGIGYAFQEVDALAPQAWDVRMDFIATENELIDCTVGDAGRGT